MSKRVKKTQICYTKCVEKRNENNFINKFIKLKESY